MRNASLTAVCFAALLAGAPAALAAEQPYSEAVARTAQAEGRPVVIHVIAPWCSTCAAQKPLVDKLVHDPKYKDLTVLDVDFDHQKAVLKTYDVRVQSTFIAFKGGKEVARSSGDTDGTSIAHLFDAAS